MHILIRPEHPEDAEGIRHVHGQAFGQPTEARIVDRLRLNCPDQFSLVAVVGNAIVGHLLFTPATIDRPDQSLQGMGLAPIGVLPQFQNQGIGTRLIQQGLAYLETQNCPFVIVLGHPSYYPRLGFIPASRYGITCEYENIPEEAFMIRVFPSWNAQDISGIAHYRPEFAEAI